MRRSILLKPMNCPHHIMIYKSEMRSATAICRCAGRVRHGLPLRADRRAERPDARARLHPGRRPPVRHAGTAAGRIHGRGRADPVRVQHARADRLPRARRHPRPAERQVRRRCRAVGPGDRGASSRRATKLRPALYGRRGRGGVLRPEARLHRPRVLRREVAAWHGAGGLQPAGPLRPGIHRRGQQRAPRR